MGTARVEIIRLANKMTLYPGQVDRRTPNPLEIISITSTEASETLSTAIAAQAGYQDLYARVSVSEAGRVGIGTGSTTAGKGYLVAANATIILPVRAGDKVAVYDVA